MHRALVRNAPNLNLNDVLLISRPFWWIATAAPFVLGYFAAMGAHWNWTLTIGVVYFSLCYGLLLYGLDDIFDNHQESRNPRRAGMDGVVLTKNKRWPLLIVVLALNIPFVVYFMIIGVPASTIWLIVMLFLAAAYSVPGLRYKEVPGLDALTSAFHYAAPFVFGVLLGGGTNFWLPALLAFFIWAAATHALGAIQDIRPDRHVHVGTIATKLGAENTIMVCLGTYFVAALLPTIYYGWKGLFVSVVMLWYVMLALSLLPFRKNPNHIVFRRAWRVLTGLNYICGFLLVGYLFILWR